MPVCVFVPFNLYVTYYDLTRTIALDISSEINEHNSENLFPSSSPAHKQMPKQDLCSMCKLVVSFLEPYVDNNSTEVRYVHHEYGACKYV